MIKAGGREDSDASTAAATNKRHSGGTSTREGSNPPGEADNSNITCREGEKIGTTTTVASTVLAASGTKSRERKHHRRRRHRNESKDTGRTNDTNGVDTSWDADGGGQEDKFKLLMEFIPYVGLGDATRDNMVRCSETAYILFDNRHTRSPTKSLIVQESRRVQEELQ